MPLLTPNALWKLTAESSEGMGHQDVEAELPFAPSPLTVWEDRERDRGYEAVAHCPAGTQRDNPIYLAASSCSPARSDESYWMFDSPMRNQCIEFRAKKRAKGKSKAALRLKGSHVE